MECVTSEFLEFNIQVSGFAESPSRWYVMHRSLAPVPLHWRGPGGSNEISHDTPPEIALSAQTTSTTALLLLEKSGLKRNKLVGSTMAYVAPRVKWHKTKSYRSDVIATAKATGCVLQFWNSLLVGDELTILSIVDDDEYEHLIDAVYDTSNIEEWKNFRYNDRGLSRISTVLISLLWSLCTGVDILMGHRLLYYHKDFETLWLCRIFYN